MSLFKLIDISQLQDTANAVIAKVKIKTDSLTSTVTALATAISGLNDEVDDIENRFVYDTTENEIGTWIDGTSVYRKVIQFTIPNTVPNVITIASIQKSINIINHSITVKISGVNDIDEYAVFTDALSFLHIDDGENISTVINLNMYSNTILTNVLGQTGYCIIEYIDTPSSNSGLEEET